MTTKQAIHLLHRLQDEQFDGIHGDERREALSMAVRALSSQQTDTDSQGLVNDCISRQAAIVVFENSGLDDDSKDTVVRVLEQLPSAQPVNYRSTKLDSSSQLKLNNDLISRQDVLKILSSKNAAWDAYDKVKRLPSAQPQRKTGRWKPLYDNIWICTNCEQTEQFGVNIESTSDYCPSCGARMVKEGEEHD